MADLAVSDKAEAPEPSAVDGKKKEKKEKKEKPQKEKKPQAQGAGQAGKQPCTRCLPRALSHYFGGRNGNCVVGLDIIEQRLSQKGPSLATFPGT